MKLIRKTNCIPEWLDIIDIEDYISFMHDINAVMEESPYFKRLRSFIYGMSIEKLETLRNRICEECIDQLRVIFDILLGLSSVFIFRFGDRLQLLSLLFMLTDQQLEVFMTQLRKMCALLCDNGLIATKRKSKSVICLIAILDCDVFSIIDNPDLMQKLYVDIFTLLYRVIPAVIWRLHGGTFVLEYQRSDVMEIQ